MSDGTPPSHTDYSSPKSGFRFAFFTETADTTTGLARIDTASAPKEIQQTFRDTFAVGMLLAGARLDQVSILLGHKIIKVTEKH